jgi:hypothetical protein
LDAIYIPWQSGDMENPIKCEWCPGSDLAISSDLVEMDWGWGTCINCGQEVPVTSRDGSWVRVSHPMRRQFSGFASSGQSTLSNSGSIEVDVKMTDEPGTDPVPARIVESHQEQAEHDLRRRFFHSFPRPKKNESGNETLLRGFRILSFMKRAGLILAPEIVKWDTKVLSPEAPPVDLLQRRASFTELATNELPKHSKRFGPISLAFDIARLRDFGATPVIYVPQAASDNPLSQIATFCVNGLYHTKYVVSKLQELKIASDPVTLGALAQLPVSPDCKLNLKNTDSAGNTVKEYEFPIVVIQNILQFVGFNNIPFDHSAAVIGYFLSLFYPTDDTHREDQLGYYRQREWRLVYSDIGVKGRPPGRALSSTEVAELNRIDPEFWRGTLTVESVTRQRSELALIYDPEPNWDFFDLVEEILAPVSAVKKIKSIVGDKVKVRAIPKY